MSLTSTDYFYVLSPAAYLHNIWLELVAPNEIKQIIKSFYCAINASTVIGLGRGSSAA
jgi:predicted small integral membrane protein